MPKADSDLQNFLDKVVQNPNLLKSLHRGAELDKFKEKYNVTHTSSLKCPACSEFGVSLGSLWMNDEDPYHFVCRKCRFTFKIDCTTVPNLELIRVLKEIRKKKPDPVAIEKYTEWGKLRNE